MIDLEQDKCYTLHGVDDVVALAKQLQAITGTRRGLELLLGGYDRGEPQTLPDPNFRLKPYDVMLQGSMCRVKSRSASSGQLETYLIYRLYGRTFIRKSNQ